MPVEVAHRMTSLCHLGNIAMRLGRKIRWDPAKEQILGDEEAAAYEPAEAGAVAKKRRARGLKGGHEGA